MIWQPSVDDMTRISSKFVILGAIAAAALVIPGMLGPLGFQEAQAAKDQSNNAINTATAGVLAANVNVQANADVSDVNVCVIARTCA